MAAFFESLYYQVIELMQLFGPIGLFFAMIIQAIISPIPSELVLFTAGASFSFFNAVLFGGLGEMAGAIVSFWISAKYGRRIVEKLIGKEQLEFSDAWFNKYGAMAVLIGRLMPFIPFDAVSYGAGLTKMKMKKFMLATFVGLIPRTLFYVFLGWASARQVETLGFERVFSAMAILAVLFIVLLIAGQKYISKRL